MMAVIINDFEVVAETPPETTGGEAAPVETPSAVSLTPRDIRDILRRQEERMARVQAY
jgi:hypothetical protein